MLRRFALDLDASRTRVQRKLAALRSGLAFGGVEAGGAGVRIVTLRTARRSRH
ncbi:hypothetical protein AB0J72_38825 [Dactylosporangium sp. NPDC049742]|uniref:hypothetical protein n=1 Tax=Dactylosporangium sp. NPDC049742 TaxID=3154737 RepID=UPI00342E1181